MLTSDAKRFAAVAVDENYIAVSQDSAWLTYSEAERREVGVNKNNRLLRDYQLPAIQDLQKVAGPKKCRFLFEMATGTGKTLLSAAVANLYGSLSALSAPEREALVGYLRSHVPLQEFDQVA